MQLLNLLHHRVVDLLPRICCPALVVWLCEQASVLHSQDRLWLLDCMTIRTFDCRLVGLRLIWREWGPIGIAEKRPFCQVLSGWLFGVCVICIDLLWHWKCALDRTSGSNMGRKQEKGHKQKKTAKAEAEDENTLSKKDKKNWRRLPGPKHFAVANPLCNRPWNYQTDWLLNWLLEVKKILKELDENDSWHTSHWNCPGTWEFEFNSDNDSLRNWHWGKSLHKWIERSCHVKLAKPTMSSIRPWWNLLKESVALRRRINPRRSSAPCEKDLHRTGQNGLKFSILRCK